MSSESGTWLKVLEPDELAEGRVKSVTCKHRTLCLTHFEGEFAALDNMVGHSNLGFAEALRRQGPWVRPWLMLGRRRSRSSRTRC